MSRGERRNGEAGASTAPTVAVKGSAVGADEADVDAAAATVASPEVGSGSVPGDDAAWADTDPHAEAADALVGVTLEDRYEITEKIGQGGMGAVYAARHTGIGKRVAIKVLLDKYAEQDQVVARLKLEAKLASSIGHANIIDITDVGATGDGKTFVVMEFLEGESLGACIQRDGPLDPQRAIRIARQAASALGAAHAKGIVHRDVKPENIFLQRRGDEDFVKVVDFGISKSMRPDDGEDSPRLTQTGMVLGTPLYMSPEQARGDEELDHSIDIYALGVILYEMVTGEVPFRGSNYLNILSQVISDEPPPPSARRPDLGRDLESVILKAMAKDPDERYRTMEALGDDLAALAGGDLRTTGARITAARWRRRREREGSLRYVFWAVGVVGVAAGVAFAVSSLIGEAEVPVAAAVTPADAAPAPAPPPELPPDPTVEILKLPIESTPPGARIFHRSRFIGITPTEFAAEKKSGTVILRAELEGYRSGRLELNPILFEGETYEIHLEPERDDDERRRRPRRTRRTRRPPPRETPPAEAERPRDEDDTGDLMENPHVP